jgi:hypothetical protein
MLMLAEAEVEQPLKAGAGAHSLVAVVDLLVDQVVDRLVGNTEHTLVLAIS